MRKIMLILRTIKLICLGFCFGLLISVPAYADITTNPFPAWPAEMGYVGMENFQHDKFSGAVAYSLGLEVASGTAGMQPVLALRYFSGNGNSSAGVGWSIDLGKITRSTRVGRPNFNDSDIFVLQLNDSFSELTSIGNGQFRTKIESFLNISKSGSNWVVKDKNGTIYEYAYNVGDLNYYLTKITDTHANFIEISYFSSDNVGYIDRITYTKGNSLTRFRTVEFVYENRNDNYPDISTGRTVIYNKRLKNIYIKVENYLYKQYELNYTYSSSSGKSLLTQVNEIGRDGSSLLVLAKLAYINNTFKFESAKGLPNPLPFSLADRDTRVGDVNGDGYPDLFRIKSGKIEISLGNGQGWNGITSYGYSYSGFDTVNANIRLGDVNGDGKDDIIKSTPYGSGAANYYVSYNNGQGWNAPVLISNTSNVSAWPAAFSIINGYIHLAYVNNDKFIDIVSGQMINLKVVYHVAYGNGSGWNNPVLIFNSLAPNFLLSPYVVNTIGSNTILADINGDGLDDIISSARNVSPNEFHFYYMLANGISWDGTIKELPLSDYFDLRWSSTKILDINKDGFPDLISGRYNNTVLGYKYMLGNGKGFGSEQSLAAFPPWSTGERNVIITDADKDGIADVVNGTEAKFSSCKLDSPQDELLKEIVNRYGGKTTFTYKSPNQAGNSVFPFSLAVLASSVVDPGVEAGAIGTTTYYYEGGLYDTVNKQFRGFRHTQTTDPLGYITHTYYHQDDSRLGKIEKQENSITRTYNTYRSDSSVPYFTPLIQTDEYTDIKCRRKTYDYDDYGNIIKTSFYGDIDVTGDEKSLVTDYSLNTAIWLLNRPSRERLFTNAEASGTAVNEAELIYDNNANYTDPPTKGDLTKRRRYLNTTSSYIQTGASYDIYGNEITETDANGNTTNTEYDSLYYSFPVTVTNPKGHTERYAYYVPIDSKGLFGQLKSKTDANANTISFEYDAFGRKAKVIGPYDSGSTYGSESYEYGINGVGANYILIRSTEDSGTGNHFIKVDILDGFQRNIQSLKESEDSQIYSFITTQYNPRGEIVKTSLPYFKGGGLRTTYLSPDISVKWTESSYDAIGRITLIAKPDTTLINNSYSGWATTITDENGHNKTYNKDGYECLLSVKENNAGQEYLTGYSYDALDNLILITDHLGNKFEYSYDSLGRRIKTTDPDMGSLIYEYDNNDNNTKIKSAYGEISFTYDQLNRPKTKDYSTQPGVEVTYNYDESASTNPIGRRTSISDLSGSSRFYYDKEGRSVKIEKNIDAAVYKIEWSYDAMSRITAITLPNLKTVTYTYNNAGLAETIAGFVQAAEYNAASQLNSITFTNPIITRFDYYPENLRLKSIISAGLQDLSYAYDNAGNLSRIIDNARSNTKDYTYDDLDRLLSGDNNIYEYNAIGNISKVNGAAQTYSSLQPHALINDGTNIYTYDNSGRLISGAGRSISYNLDNLPVSINKDGLTTQFVYDADGKRVKKTVTDGTTSTTTVYIEDLYEKEIVN